MSDVTVTLSGSARITVPKTYAEHPLVAGRYFYTLPKSLLQVIVQETNAERFDPDLLRMERVLADALGEHTTFAGFAHGRPLPYHLLEPRPDVSLSGAELAAIGVEKNPAQLKILEGLFTERLRAFGNWVRGYCGWLLSNPSFLSEHDELLHRHRSAILANGFPKPVQAKFGADMPVDDGEFNAMCQEFAAFYERWRLQLLAGPYLPLPLEAQVPSVLPPGDAVAPNAGVACSRIPDTCPLTGHGPLNDTMEDALRAANRPEHLAGWLDMARSSNAAKNEIDRHGRLFRIQHDLRQLYSRHADALRRAKGKLQEALSHDLRVSVETIKRDWRHLDGRLGRDWHLRPDPLVG